ncbi:hypothetical protein [Schleiferilactobacillus perolens]|nr:hypothetical protein [Schleiferilactobacillus perolens]
MAPTIQEQPLYMQYLISTQHTASPDEWATGLNELQEVIVDKEFYQVAPVVVKMARLSDDRFQFIYYVPISLPLTGNSQFSEQFHYVDKLAVDHALVLRQANNTASYRDAIKILEEYANQNGYTLSGDYYMVVTEIYDTYVLDIFAKLESGWHA